MIGIFGGALRIAQALGWAKSYDAEYVALAEALACPLLTIDVRLIRSAGSLVELIGPAALTG
jgi:predicted nucleic acid-binding protein